MFLNLKRKQNRKKNEVEAEKKESNNKTCMSVLMPSTFFLQHHFFLPCLHFYTSLYLFLVPFVRPITYLINKCIKKPETEKVLAAKH